MAEFLEPLMHCYQALHIIWLLLLLLCMIDMSKMHACSLVNS